MAFELHPHQVKAVRELHNGAILGGGVGVGKSITALAYWYIRECNGMPRVNGMSSKPMQTPKDVVVVTTKKKVDSNEWLSEAARFGVSESPGPYGVRIRVITWNKIETLVGLVGSFVIFDEQRLVGNGAWVKAFYKVASANSWIVLSATPGDQWMDYVPVFIANGYYKNRSEFGERHVVWKPYSKYPQIQRFLEVGRLERLRDQVLVDMPYVRHTKRHDITIGAEYDELAFRRVWKERWNVFEDRPIKDVGELFRVARKLVNTDPSRLGALLTLIDRHPKLIVFYNFNYELDMMRTIAEMLDISVAEWNGQRHEEIPKAKKWLYLVQYTAGAEGWNCVETDATVFWSLSYSWRSMEQARGRIDRMNTPFTDLYYYIFRSEALIDKYIWKAIASKKLFNEKAFAKERRIAFVQEDLQSAA